ncbi:MAG: ferredoxin III, nif-specific [Thermodesulfobacteriota bacterium]
MPYITGLTRNGQEWTPMFVKAIDEELCIGCGRCYKVCAHDVLGFEELDEDDSAKMLMKVERPGNCIGCQACGRTCAKKAFAFEPVALS